MISLFDKLSDRINLVVEKIAILLISILTLVTTIGVINRFVFGKPIVWLYEVSSVIFAWTVFSGISIAYKKNEHIQLDFLYNFASEKYKKIIKIIIELISVLFLVIVVKDGVEIIKNTAPQKYNTINLSTAWFYASFTVNAAISLIHLTDALIKQLLDREKVLVRENVVQ